MPVLFGSKFFLKICVIIRQNKALSKRKSFFNQKYKENKNMPIYSGLKYLTKIDRARTIEEILRLRKQLSKDIPARTVKDSLSPKNI